MCDTLSHSGIAYFDKPWVEITHSQKGIYMYMYMQEVLCGVIDCIMKLKYWFCGHDKDACYIYACIIYVNICVCVYIPPYVCIYIYTHTHTHTHTQ
jgi:hypothetical protein